MEKSPDVPQIRNSNQRHEWLVTLRAVACLMVVLLHVAATPVLHPDLVTQTSWATAFGVDAFVRVCVPLFFMMSGFLFLGEKSPELRHIRRLVSALAFYSMIALGWITLTAGVDVAIDTALSFMRKPVFYHLWYFYAAIGLYLIAMGLRLRLERPMIVLAAVIVLLTLLNPSLPVLWGNKGATAAIAISGGLLTYFLFAVAGAALARVIDRPAFRRPMTYAIVYLAASFTTFLLTYSDSRAIGAYDGTFFSYGAIFVVIAALAFFMMVATLRPPTGQIKLFTRVIADRSLAIYGLHAFVLRLVEALELRPWHIGAAEIPITFLFVTLVTFALASLLILLDKRRHVT